MDNFEFNSGDFLSDLLVAATGELSEPQRKVFNKAYQNAQLKNGCHSIKFIIDGIELPVHTVFDKIGNDIEQMVNKQAVDLIDQRFGDIEDGIRLLTQIISQTQQKLTKRIAKDLNVKINQDDLW